MTRRRVRWWAYLAVNPSAFLKSSDGRFVLELLTQWWIEAEHIYRPDLTIPVTKSIRLTQAYDRYTRAKFYRRLADHRFPPLGGSKELALDSVYDAFQTWTRSSQARKLADRSLAQVRAAIENGFHEGAQLDLDLDPALMTRLGSAVKAVVDSDVPNTIHHAVHHSLQDAVHSAVHSAVHAAAQADPGHDSGTGHSGGGHDSGGHGGGGHH